MFWGTGARAARTLLARMGELEGNRGAEGASRGGGARPAHSGQIGCGRGTSTEGGLSPSSSASMTSISSLSPWSCCGASDWMLPGRDASLSTRASTSARSTSLPPTSAIRLPARSAGRARASGSTRMRLSTVASSKKVRPNLSTRAPRAQRRACSERGTQLDGRSGRLT